MNEEDIKKNILDLITNNPGIDAEEVARRLEISDLQVVSLTKEMLREGVLDFDDRKN